MGVASSVRILYKSASKWFQMYMDKESYMVNFSEIDRDGDAGVNFQEFRNWVHKHAVKAGPDSAWRVMLDSGPVLMMAHKMAASSMDSTSTVSAGKEVDITEFRALFIHIYVFTCLWEHFARGEASDPDMYRKKIDSFEFRLSCQSLNALHARGVCSPEETLEAFVSMDSNFSGKIGFVTMCMNAAKYIDEFKNEAAATETEQVLDESCPSPPLGSTRPLSAKPTKAQRLLGISVDTSLAGATLGELTGGPKQIYSGLSVPERTEIAMLQLHARLRNEHDNILRHHEIRLFRGSNPGEELPPHLRETSGCQPRETQLRACSSKEAETSIMRRGLDMVRGINSFVGNAADAISTGRLPMKPGGGGPDGERLRRGSSGISQPHPGSISRQGSLRRGSSFRKDAFMPEVAETSEREYLSQHETHPAPDNTGTGSKSPDNIGTGSKSVIGLVKEASGRFLRQSSGRIISVVTGRGAADGNTVSSAIVQPLPSPTEEPPAKLSRKESVHMVKPDAVLKTVVSWKSTPTRTRMDIETSASFALEEEIPDNASVDDLRAYQQRQLLRLSSKEDEGSSGKIKTPDYKYSHLLNNNRANSFRVPVSPKPSPSKSPGSPKTSSGKAIPSG